MTCKNPLTLIKIGSNVLTTPSRLLDLNTLRELVKQISLLHALYDGQVLVVSSGAILSGAERLQITPTTVQEKQAAAAVGQILLMQEYAAMFEKKGIQIAQVLLTKQSLIERDSQQHIRNTIDTLLKHGVIPIINENDTVATEELDTRFGDNDQLSVHVSALLNVKQMIVLTDIDGLFHKNPKIHADAVLIKDIPVLNDQYLGMADHSKSSGGSGGMNSKLLAARQAQLKGIDVYICNGKTPGIIQKTLMDRTDGTHIHALQINR